MNAITLISFAEALAMGDASLRTLRNIIVVNDNGRPCIRRTSLFAEAEVEADGRRCLLCVPLTDEAMRYAERAAHALSRACCRAVPDYRILRNEIECCDSSGRMHLYDAVLQVLPEGDTLDVAAAGSERSLLRPALALLRSEMAGAGLLHGNLKPANIIWGSDRRLWPVRCHYVRGGASAAEAEAEWDAVERYLDSLSIPDSGCRAVEYASPSAWGFDEVFPVSDLMHRVRRGMLYGYADESGTTIVEPVYVRADDFAENRAVVATDEGTGVIDRTGAWIVAPRYEDVEFDVDRGVFVACSDGGLETLDYAGNVLSAAGTGCTAKK